MKGWSRTPSCHGEGPAEGYLLVDFTHAPKLSIPSMATAPARDSPTSWHKIIGDTWQGSAARIRRAYPNSVEQDIQVISIVMSILPCTALYRHKDQNLDAEHCRVHQLASRGHILTLRACVVCDVGTDLCGGCVDGPEIIDEGV